MSNTRQAILTALIEGTIVELLVKTNVYNVYVDDTTTLAAKLAEIIASVNTKATPDTVTSAVNALRQELLGDTPTEAYNTFTELAKYIAEHEDVADALTAAIGNKADKNTVETIQATVNALGSLSKKSAVSESDLDTALKEKVNAASQGNHSHSNKTVLDGITADTVSNWNGKGKIYAQTTQPANLTANDLWVKLI